MGPGAVGVEVAQQGDLGAVVDDLPVDVGDQDAERLVGVRALGRTARPRQAVLAEAADAPDPLGVGLVELGQRTIGGAGVGEGLVVDERTAEMGRVAGAEDADDDVPEPPGRSWSPARARARGSRSRW